jgi:hypothetical protein
LAQQLAVHLHAFVGFLLVAVLTGVALALAGGWCGAVPLARRMKITVPMAEAQAP